VSDALVVTLGQTELDWDALPPGLKPPDEVVAGPGARPARDLRSWGTYLNEEIEQLGADVVGSGLRLPKIDPVLRAFATEPLDDLVVVLVTTNQADDRLRHTDTATLGEALALLLPSRVKDLTGASRAPVAAMPLTGNPASFEAMWKQTARLAGVLEERAIRRVHLACTGGTPAMGYATKVRFYAERDRGRFDSVTSWALRWGAGGPVSAVKERTIEVLSTAAARGNVRDLAQRHQYEDVEVLAVRSDPALFKEERRGAIADLAVLGRALLALDLRTAAATKACGSHPKWKAEVDSASFPSARAGGGGALDSLVPLFGMLLDAVRVHELRGDSSAVVAFAHLVNEYLPHLAWESVLGHAADPRRLRNAVSGDGSRFGRITRSQASGRGCARCEPDGPEACPHPAHLKDVGAAIRAGIPDSKALGEFLPKKYSYLGDALMQCGLRESVKSPESWGRSSVSGCKEPCGWWSSGNDGPEAVTSLPNRLRLAALFGLSPLVQLRHSGPYGHFFAVPDTAMVAGAWNAFGAVARKRNLAPLWKRADVEPPVDLSPHEGIAQQLGGLVSAVAGAPVKRSTLLDEVSGEIVAVVRGSER